MRFRYEAHWQRLRERFASEYRLRLAGWTILLLLALQVAAAIHDSANSHSPRIQELAQRHDRLEQVLAHGDWQARAEAARNHRQAIEERFPVASSPGVARAELQGRLENMVRRNGMNLLDLEMRPPVQLAEHPGMFRIGAVLQLEQAPLQLLRLLASIADAPGAIVVGATRFDLRGRSRMQLELHAVYRIDEADA